MKLRSLFLPAVVWLFLAIPGWAIDAFDRQSYAMLKAGGEPMLPLTELTAGQAAGWKTLAPSITSPTIVVKTNDNHYAKALVSWGLRKGKEKPTPVLIIEKYVTFNRERPEQALATGKNVMLFPGFAFNFEIGQVVPAELGADIEFTAERKLKPLGEAKLFGLNGSLPAPAAQANQYDPTDHEGVVPEDFAGSWNLNADGRWLGRWDLVVDEEGKVKGNYISAESQSSYPLKGRISGAPHRLTLEVELANAVQEYEAFLWTTDKSAMAGTTTMVERRFGFYATRIKPEGEATATTEAVPQK